MTVGDYKVFITFDIAPSQLETPAAGILSTVPKMYLAQGTSNLIVSVNQGKNEHNFDLK